MWIRIHAENLVTFHIQLVPVLSIVAGVLILIKPKLLNYVVAVYLIVVGVLGIVNY